MGELVNLVASLDSLRSLSTRLSFAAVQLVGQESDSRIELNRGFGNTHGVTAKQPDAARASRRRASAASRFTDSLIL
jgi:hypothetical protein